MEIRQPGSHLDQLIRQTRSHHVRLSSMADMKANMILTLASLMIPLSIRYLDVPRVQWAAVTMIGFCVLTVILSAYAAMPKVSLRLGKRILPNIDNPMFNILFFGSFIDMDYDRFKGAMENIMNDHSMAYEVQLREVYTMGQYLSRQKYRFIMLAYISFITGVVLSTAVYGLDFLF